MRERGGDVDREAAWAWDLEGEKSTQVKDKLHFPAQSLHSDVLSDVANFDISTITLLT